MTESNKWVAFLSGGFHISEEFVCAEMFSTAKGLRSDEGTSELSVLVYLYHAQAV